MCVLSAVVDPAAVRLGRLLDVPVVSTPRALLLARPHLVLVRGPVDTLRRAALLTTLVGARAVIALPVGPASPLPWWGRRFHRLVFGTQAEARAWGAVGVALGRLVVVEAGADAVERSALHAVIGEVLSMARRPDMRRRAR